MSETNAGEMSLILMGKEIGLCTGWDEMGVLGVLFYGVTTNAEGAKFFGRDLDGADVSLCFNYGVYHLWDQDDEHEFSEYPINLVFGDANVA